MDPRTVYDLFFSDGEVVEIRSYGNRGSCRAWDGFAGGHGVVFGYFDNAQDFGRAAGALEAAAAPGIYFTANPVYPDFLSRAPNRLVAAGQKSKTTSDKNIQAIRWLLIDFDPRRIGPGGELLETDIPSSGAEYARALELRNKVQKDLEGELVARGGVAAISGNGAHLMYRLADLPNNDATVDMMQQALRGLAAMYGTDHVEIDLKVYNPSRIWKLYGTTARKGYHTETRPHRKSFIEPSVLDVVKGLEQIPVNGWALLERLAALAPAAAAPTGPAPAAPPSPRPAGPGRLGPLHVEQYLAHYGREFTHEVIDGKDWYFLKQCVFNPQHKGKEAAIVQSAGPPYLTYSCVHDSCKAQRWADAKRVISGDDKLAQFCDGYDPTWTPSSKRPAQPTDSSPAGDLPATACDMHPHLVETYARIDHHRANVPPPSQVDPRIFWRPTKTGQAFIPWYLAQYLLDYLHPIVFAQAAWWRYLGGVWRKLDACVIEQVAVLALRETAAPQRVSQGIDTLRGMCVVPDDEWQPNPRYINCLSGMIDIEALAGWNFDDDHLPLVPHDPKYRSVAQVPCRLDLDAAMNKWYGFLGQVFKDIKVDSALYLGRDKIDLLRQFFGYCLLPDCRFQKSLALYGEGSNGKSVILNILTRMLGEENTCSLSIRDMTERFLRTAMQGKMANISSEAPTNDPVSVEVFKAVVSGDSITCDVKYGVPFKFRPYCKVIQSMNKPPIITDRTHGFARRMMVMRFYERFEGAQVDEQLAEKIAEEMDAIFVWSVSGLADLLRRRGFDVPDQVVDETNTFLAELNPLMVFCEEILISDQPDDVALCTAVWAAYKRWCRHTLNKPLARQKFNGQLLGQMPHVVKRQWGPDRHWHFIGCRLNHDAINQLPGSDDEGAAGAAAPPTGSIGTRP